MSVLDVHTGELIDRSQLDSEQQGDQGEDASQQDQANLNDMLRDSMADNSAAMGGHNLGCGDDDEEEGRLPDDNFYDNKVAKVENVEEDAGNKSSTARGGLRSRAVANHIPGTEEVQMPTVSTVWSGYPEWMAGCLARLYQSEDLCDVTLDVGLRTAAGDMRDEKRSMFRVHRVILSALSKEFRDIFSTFSANFGDEDDGSRLHRMNIVRIEEDASLFQALLEFIYTGKLDCIVKSSSERVLSSRGEALVEMASRYGLDGIVKLSLEQCSRGDEVESNSSDKYKGGRKSSKSKQRTGLRSQQSNKLDEAYSKETSSWSCKICLNTFTSVQGFYRHAKHHKSANLCWSCVKCNDAEAFPTVCRALSHFSTAAATGVTELEDHKIFRCILCQHICNGKKELLTHDCSRLGGTIGRPRQSKSIKKEPGLDEPSDYDEFDDGREMDNDEDEDYKPELDGHLPLPNAFLNLSNDDIDKELGDQDMVTDGSMIGAAGSELSGTYMNAMKQKSKTGTSHHKHKRKGRQPANPGQPKEKKKSTWAAINEKNYLCNLCGKTLKGLTAYKRHQVVHTGARPYECDVCGKTFTQNQRLTVHHRMHTGERPYLCSLCGKTFTESCKLKRHLTRVHKAETGGSKLIAGSMMGTQPLPAHQQPGGGGPLGLKKQQDFLAAQAAAVANVSGIQNLGHIVDGEEIETKHQPGIMLPPQQGHGSLGAHSQTTHPLQTHQQVLQGHQSGIPPHQQQVAAAMAQQQQLAAAAAAAAAAAEQAQLTGGMSTAGAETYAAAQMAAHAAQLAAQVKRGVVGNYNQQHHGGGSGHHGRPPGNSGGGQGNKKMPLNV